MSLDDQKNVDILLAALSERYEAMRVIRGRVQDTALWILGVLIGASGWLVTSSIVLTAGQKLSFLVALASSFAVIRFLYLDDLFKGFRAQQKVAAEIENALGLFTPGRFGTSATSIYPAKWSHAGTARGKGRFFMASHAMIDLAAGLLAATIFLKGIVF
jgi:hypothetical protein